MCIFKKSITGLVITVMTAQMSAQLVYAEFPGPGMFSANYEKRTGNNYRGFGFRAGAGVNPLRTGYRRVAFPVGLNYLIGKQGPGYAETGLTITLIRSKPLNTAKAWVNYKVNLLAGYRRQSVKGFVFRIFASPVILQDFNEEVYDLIFFGGISFGYNFKGKKKKY